MTRVFRRVLARDRQCWEADGWMVVGGHESPSAGDCLLLEKVEEETMSATEGMVCTRTAGCDGTIVGTVCDRCGGQLPASDRQVGDLFAWSPPPVEPMAAVREEYWPARTSREVSQRLGLSRAAAYALLNALEELGLARRAAGIRRGARGKGENLYEVHRDAPRVLGERLMRLG